MATSTWVTSLFSLCKFSLGVFNDVGVGRGGVSRRILQVVDSPCKFMLMSRGEEVQPLPWNTVAMNPNAMDMAKVNYLDEMQYANELSLWKCTVQPISLTIATALFPPLESLWIFVQSGAAAFTARHLTVTSRCTIAQNAERIPKESSEQNVDEANTWASWPLRRPVGAARLSLAGERRGSGVGGGLWRHWSVI